MVAVFAQYEGGFVKILEDKRYQDGATFGNFRDQEDGTKYFEETDADGIRRGYWEYVDQAGQVLRTEFEGKALFAFFGRVDQVIFSQPDRRLGFACAH